jgi:hypothetical protein
VGLLFRVQWSLIVTLIWVHYNWLLSNGYAYRYLLYFIRTVDVASFALKCASQCINKFFTHSEFYPLKQMQLHMLFYSRELWKCKGYLAGSTHIVFFQLSIKEGVQYIADILIWVHSFLKNYQASDWPRTHVTHHTPVCTLCSGTCWMSGWLSSLHICIFYVLTWSLRWNHISSVTNSSCGSTTCHLHFTAFNCKHEFLLHNLVV